MTGQAKLPLEGLKVVALEQAIAVPLATRHMADLGADVWKIERPGGDFARAYDSLAGGLSVHFAWTNRGKRSVVLDLKTDAGRERAVELASGADVFVANVGPGVVERLGLGWEALHRVAPRLVHCELTGYGEGGPLAGRKAYDLLVQSETGAASVSGTPEAPAKVGISIVDISGAMYVLSGVLAALVQRNETGEGVRLRLNLFDSISEWMSVPLLQAKYGGSFVRSGRFHNAIFPYGPFACADGEVVLAVQNDAEWERLCARLDLPALSADPRFATTEGRHLHRGEIQAVLGERLAGMTRLDAITALDEAGVPVAESNSVEAAAVHPHLLERGRWVTSGSEFGEVELLRSPFDQDGQWPTPPGRVPGLGDAG